MYSLSLTSFLALCFFFLSSVAAYGVEDLKPTLSLKITEMFNTLNTKSKDFPVNLTVNILTPTEKLSGICTNPKLSLPGNTIRLVGNQSVIAQCDAQRTFIQITVQAEGTWWTANHNIRPGRVIQRDDIQSHYGSLEHLPKDLVLNPASIVGHVPTRIIRTSLPITKSQLRKSWCVTAGQEVDVVATGTGFRILTKGKALGNAAQDETLRVQSHSGQLINGTVMPDCKIKVDLK